MVGKSEKRIFRRVTKSASTNLEKPMGKKKAAPRSEFEEVVLTGACCLVSMDPKDENQQKQTLVIDRITSSRSHCFLSKVGYKLPDRINLALTITMATKVWRVKKTVASSDHQRTSKQNNPKQAGPVASSGDTGSSQEQKEIVISLDRLNLGPKKKLLVIPLRGVIVHRAHCSRPDTIPRNRTPDFSYGNFLVYKRPYCVDFLKFCFQRFHVGLWSSAKEYNLQRNLTNVMGDLKNKLLFTWDQEHCTNSGFMCLENQDKPLFFKELSHLWDKKYPNLPWSDGEYSASNTLLITDPAKALLNPPNTAIFPTNYDPKNKKDDFLGPKGKLRVFLNGLADADDVQTYVESHPIGEPEITPSHPEWDHYCKIICSFNKKRNGDLVKLI